MLIRRHKKEKPKVNEKQTETSKKPSSKKIPVKKAEGKDIEDIEVEGSKEATKETLKKL